jgi:predicted DsbA family dithiol-disulfide isomerase
MIQSVENDEALVVFSDYVCPFCYLGKASLEKYMESSGVEMTLELSRDVDSWHAHKVALWMRDHAEDATFEAFNDLVFDALWQDARDIGDPEVLVDLAEEVGVDEALVREAVSSEAIETRINKAMAESREMGIRGVPAFSSGRRECRELCRRSDSGS